MLLESKLKTSLNDVVMKVLGISLDVFSKDILDNEKFNAMIQKKIEFEKNSAPSSIDANKSKDGPDFFFSLYPKSEADQYFLKNAFENNKKLAKLLV